MQTNNNQRPRTLAEIQAELSQLRKQPDKQRIKAIGRELRTRKRVLLTALSRG